MLTHLQIGSKAVMLAGIWVVCLADMLVDSLVGKLELLIVEWRFQMLEAGELNKFGVGLIVGSDDCLSIVDVWVE